MRCVTTDLTSAVLAHSGIFFIVDCSALEGNMMQFSVPFRLVCAAKSVPFRTSALPFFRPVHTYTTCSTLWQRLGHHRHHREAPPPQCGLVLAPTARQFFQRCMCMVQPPPGRLSSQTMNEGM